jgi:hypothetical protein
LIMAETYRFQNNPFVLEDYISPIYDMGDSSPRYDLSQPAKRWVLSPELQRENPALFDMFTNVGNFQTMPYVDGMDPQFRVKTGDKEGTLYSLQQDNGGFLGSPQSIHNWDSNDQLRKWGPFLPPMMMAGAFGLSQVAPGMFNSAASGAGGTASTAPAASATSGLSGAAGSSASGLSQAELAALVESGTTGTAGAGLEAAALGGAGLTPAQYGLLQSGGALAAPAASSGWNLVKELAKATGLSESAIKTLIPLAGGAASYFDAKRQDGKVQGYQPSIDVLTANAQRQFAPPQFSTSIPPPPQFSTGLLPDMNFARPRLGLIG